MGSIKTRDFFTAENFRQINGDNYRPDDIRTYQIPPLASDPYSDIHAHICVPEHGQRGTGSVSTNRGTFNGLVTTQTMEKAQKLILHFPKASDIKTPKGVVQIDRKKMPNLYPSWMITRYGRKHLPEDLSLYHETPLFLDKKTKEFLYFFDESFLAELDPKILTDSLETDLYRIYRDSDGQRFLALRSTSFDAVEMLDGKSTNHSAVNHAFKTIRDNCRKLTLDAQSLEQVIVVSFSGDNIPRMNDASRIESGLSTSLSLTFAKAVRHNENYYWIQPDGSIASQVTNVIHRDHAKDRGRFSGIGGPGLSGLRGEIKHGSTIVIPYTEEEWAQLVAIKQRLDDVRETLKDLMDGCKGPVGSSSDFSVEKGLASLSSAGLLGVDC